MRGIQLALAVLLFVSAVMIYVCYFRKLGGTANADYKRSIKRSKNVSPVDNIYSGRSHVKIMKSRY